MSPGCILKGASDAGGLHVVLRVAIFLEPLQHAIALTVREASDLLKLCTQLNLSFFDDNLSALQRVHIDGHATVIDSAVKLPGAEQCTTELKGVELLLATLLGAHVLKTVTNELLELFRTLPGHYAFALALAIALWHGEQLDQLLADGVFALLQSECLSQLFEVGRQCGSASHGCRAAPLRDGRWGEAEVFHQPVAAHCDFKSSEVRVDQHLRIGQALAPLQRHRILLPTKVLKHVSG